MEEIEIEEILQKWADDQLAFINEVSTMSNMCKYNFLAWEWIERKFYV